MDNLYSLVEKLCLINGPSGSEESVSAYIMEMIKPYCEAKIDINGNIIAFKKGKNTPKNKIMLDAHTDEVGFIITSVTDDGFLKFETLGGITVSALVCKTININGHKGVIGAKPIHLSTSEERQKMPSLSDLLIDIGATDKNDALKYVKPGDSGTFLSDYVNFCGNTVMTKALDDRIGCAILIELLKLDSNYDYYATFTVGEELGCHGAKTAAFTVSPDIAVVIEGTTANDINNDTPDKAVCFVGNGPVVSFMDRATLYDGKLYNLALETAKSDNIPVQIKNAVAGGNNAGAITVSGKGVRTLAVSLPCRYIHSPSSVADLNDGKNMFMLIRALLDKLCTLNDKNY